jgi:hypothetical protein
MMQVGADYYENLTLEKVDDLLQGFKSEGKRKSYTDQAENKSA